MKITLNKDRLRKAIVPLVCIIIILIIIVAGVVIYKLIKLCKEWFKPPPPKDPPQIVEVQAPRIYGLNLVPADQLPVVNYQIKQMLSSTNSPCNGFEVPVMVPSELSNAIQVWVQRSTNLQDWEDLTSFVYDPSNPVVSTYCDTNPPFAMGFYRLRAWIP